MTGAITATGRTGAAPRRRAAGSLAAIVAAVVLLVGCAGGSDEERLAELAARPSMEEMVARYEVMLARIAQRLSDELGPYPWERYDNASSAGCGFDFPPGSGGDTRSLRDWQFDGNISDADWPRAEQIVREVVVEYGFTPFPGAVDRPGHHITNAADTELGASFRLGTQVNTSMGLATGCHLPDAARDTSSEG
jgi:hypothetical protein